MYWIAALIFGSVTDEHRLTNLKETRDGSNFIPLENVVNTLAMVFCTCSDYCTEIHCKA